MSKEAMKLALEALIQASGHVNNDVFVKVMMARDAVVEALAKQEQDEPVAWIEHEWAGTGLRKLNFERHEPTVRDEVVNPIWTPLYIKPQPSQKPWVGLTDADIEIIAPDIYGSFHYDDYKFARAVEAKLKEKNHE